MKVVQCSSSPLNTKQLQRAGYAGFFRSLLQDDAGMPLDIQSKKLILPIVLVQGLDHVHVDDAGVEWAFDLEIKSV